jgi:hypothetical protein
VEELFMKISNEDVTEAVVEVPDGHKHIRTRILLQDGSELIFQEATIANIVRAYITLKTDPSKTSVRLKGRKIEERKKGYAEWQLVED